MSDLTCKSDGNTVLIQVNGAIHHGGVKREEEKQER